MININIDKERKKKSYVLSNKGQLGITPEFVNKVTFELDSENNDLLCSLLISLHPADLADLIETLNEDCRIKIVKVLGNNFPPETLPSMNVPILTGVLDLIPKELLVNFLSELESDDATYVLEICEGNLRKEIISKLSKEDQKLIKKSLNYDEDSAGRLMQTDYVSVPVNWTIGQVIDYLRESQYIPDEFYSLFAVDSRHVPVGTVPLHRAMRTRREIYISEVMTKEPKIIKVNTNQEDIAFLFDQYELTSAPVVDNRGRLIGMITIDDVVDVIREQADEDILKLAGVKAEGDIYLAAFQTARNRFGWLAINLLTAVLASISIAFFSGTIKELVSLAILMPIVASMGGNAGTQTLTVAVRAMATRELTATNSLRVFGKEIIVGTYNGIFFAVIIGIITGIWFGDVLLGLIIAFAMLFNLVVAGTFGAAIPLLLSYFKVDPAVAATVLLTTITDVIGFMVFLGLAEVFLV